VHCGRVGFVVVERGTCLGQHVAGDGFERLADRKIRINGGFLAHMMVL
jgi:hypothetical protein